MSGVPFGFGVPSDDDEPGKWDPEKFQPGMDNPFSALFGGDDPAAIGAMFAQLGQLMSWTGGPVNWDLAKDVARKTVASGADPSVTEPERREVDDAVRLAELWLDPVTAMPAGATGSLAWSRAEWVESTLPVWGQLVEPVAARVVEAMGDVVPDEMKGYAVPLLGVMRQMGGAMFGAQVGQALGSLAGEVVGATDIGLPLGPAGKAVLLPANVTKFGEGLGVDLREVRLYLALREAAHQRLFAHVPWLRQHLLGAVEAYARGITVDMSRLEQIVGGLDPGNPMAIQEALTEGMFNPQTTPEQTVALNRLETALALVEGWVDAVAGEAAAAHLGSADALRETVRRRRAGGGPAEQTFSTLVGPRTAPASPARRGRLWQALGERRGIDGRDAVWAHPDLLPTSEDLDDPLAFVEMASFDLSSLLDEPGPDVPDPDAPKS